VDFHTFVIRRGMTQRERLGSEVRGPRSEV
jgi:hypothetical protein